jgi:DNA topoisomerase-1
MATLILAEKPSSAKLIANALAEKSVKSIKSGKVVYYQIKRAGQDIIVAPAAGHLFLLKEKAKKEFEYPIFDVGWQPVWQVNKKAVWAKDYFQLLKKLAKNVNSFIAATDFDIEGSVIAYNVFRFIYGIEKAKRMAFSTLTKADIIEAYEKASSELDWPQIKAGLTRHQLDFYWGINLSRALMLALKAAGGYKTLSIGRVQGPTLAILEKRQTEIEQFKPKPYWQLQLVLTKDGKDIIAIHTKGKFWKKEEIDILFEKCKGKTAFVSSVVKREQRIPPGYPFDLTSLQREAFRFFGFSPKRTLDIAQSLYEQALISYPRTASQKLPEKIGYKTIIEQIGKQKIYSQICSNLLAGKLKPREGPKTDPAHPAIFPTGLSPKGLNEWQKKLYDMIVRRFLATFSKEAVLLATKVSIDLAGQQFKTEGVQIRDEGWTSIYYWAKSKEALLPKIEKGEKILVKLLNIVEKTTSPPPYYNQASILKKMEIDGLGTKGTRALILQTLYDRGYIAGQTIKVTELGRAVVRTLSKYCPEIISVELTKKFENDMERIQKGEEEVEKVTDHAKRVLTKILAKFKKFESAIGQTLLTSLKATIAQQSVIGPCECGGQFVIKYTKTGKPFVACNKWPTCTKTYSLPHSAKLTVLDQKCVCGMKLIEIREKGKRSWKLCPRCGFKK